MALSLRKEANPVTDAKRLLREACLPSLTRHSKYFSSSAIRDCLKARGSTIKPATLNRYLVEVKGGNVHSAGKGWYSSIPREFVLDTKPLQEVIALLTAKYPLLSFACWSTEQIRNFVHHTLNKFVSFVYVNPDAARPVFDTLRGAGWNAYLDPKPTEVPRTFTVRDKTIVVRDTRAKEVFTADHVVPVERLLVYLFREAKRLNIMDTGEYATMARRLAESGRINMGMLQGLADDHKVPIMDIVRGESTIAET
jgi:hypothetical protein